MTLLKADVSDGDVDAAMEKWTEILENCAEDGYWAKVKLYGEEYVWTLSNYTYDWTVSSDISVEKEVKVYPVSGSNAE